MSGGILFESSANLLVLAERLIFFTAVLFVVAGFGVYLLLNPSRYMRRNPRPRMKDTPWTRIQLRAVGFLIKPL
jgi:hypothetical protein